MQDQSAAGKDLVGALLVAIPVLLGWVPMPLQALFLWLALPLLLTGSRPPRRTLLAAATVTLLSQLFRGPSALLG